MTVAYTDQDLVQAIKSKRQVAFDYLYDRYAPAFYGELKRTIYREEKASEALTRCFAAIWTDVDSYDFKQSFFTWCLRKVKKEASRQKIDLVLYELFSCERNGKKVSSPFHSV